MMLTWKKTLFSLLAFASAKAQIKSSTLIHIEERVIESDLEKIRLIKYLAKDVDQYLESKVQNGEIMTLPDGKVSIKLNLSDILSDFGLVNTISPGNADGTLCTRTTTGGQ